MLSRTNVVLDSELIDEAARLTGLKTKKDIINFALDELIKQQRRKKLLTIRHPGLWQGDLEGMRAKRHDSA